MTSRPRRSAATKATDQISAHAKLADADERSDRSTMSSRRSGRGASRYDDEFDTSRSKTRQPTRASSGRRSGNSDAAEVRHGTRNRGGKKNYVVDSSPDDEEEDDAEVESDQMDVDAEGEDDVDAEGEEEDAEGEDAEGEDAEGEDAEGDVDMDFAAPASKNSIKVSRQAAQPKPILKLGKSKAQASDDDDDDELSEADSDLEDQTMGMGDDTMADEDAEGEEIEVAGDGDEDDEEEEDEEDEEDVDAEGEDAEGETQMEDAEGEELDSEDDESRAMTPDFAKMTKRQRARFEDEPQEYMKLSDEVQVKKHFTAEELSMRRQEMARRRRNLSEKRNEEVKMETINKLLKKQAPKVSKKAAVAGVEVEEEARPEATWIRWVNNKNGSKVAVSEEIFQGPGGVVFGGGKSLPPGKMVEEVA